MSDLDEPRMVMLPAETLEQIGRSVTEMAQLYRHTAEALTYIVEHLEAPDVYLRLEAKLDQLIKALKAAGVGFWRD